ncbi:MAG: 50S ribosomal protein L5 [Candidatus Omnitrophota bacterium]|nr:50S ribosomal protein L5 [Candidatus Omnitrophota bacterium]
MVRLLELYNNEIIPKMLDKFGFKNKLAIPRLKKLVVNMGVGEGAQDIKILEQAMAELAIITGQKPIKTLAKKAVAGFKIRAGVPVGCKVTLRGRKMYEFLDRLINVTLPRVRDFRGVPKGSFDKKGNYSLGINEQTIFPEIDYDKVQRTQGMDITVVFTGDSDKQNFELLRLMGMPFRK